MLAEFSERTVGRVLAAGLVISLAVGGCAPAPTKNATTKRAVAATRPALKGAAEWLVHTARRQATYVRLDLKEVVPGMRITVGSPDGPADYPLGEISVYSARVTRGIVTGPDVDQLTGHPSIQADTGSYLLPAAVARADEGLREFTLTEPMPVVLRIDVPLTQDPGTYRFPVTILMPGKGGAGTLKILQTEVADIALPAEPRVLGVATTTVDDLSRIFPTSFAGINGVYLDRDDPLHAPAVKQLDALVAATEREGLALYVEDITPRVRVDEVGRVAIDWDTYDKLMQPYMDGSAFADRIPLQTWLAPVPPRRLRDTPTQLRQYMAACVEHFSQKGWVATPVFMHPAMVEPAGEEAKDAKLQADIAQAMEFHLSRDMLAVTTPDATVAHARMWNVDDSDFRLPPAGRMATDQTVREWPWVCAGRGVRGFVWRNAVAGAAEIKQNVAWDESRRPLLVALEAPAPAKGAKPEKKGTVVPPPVRTVVPTLRMMALSTGMSDTATFALLEKRTDAAMANEVLGGLVGRTGLAFEPAKGALLPMAQSGFVYAGWPTDKDVWGDLPGMLDKLVLAGDPGQRTGLSTNDPLYLQTKLWLAAAHRPVARVSGYMFSLHPGLDGVVLETNVLLRAENPVGAAVEFQTQVQLLPGDLSQPAGVAGAPMSTTMAPYGTAAIGLKAAGHLESLVDVPPPAIVAITETNGGAVLRLPVYLPVHRATAVEDPPKIDGKGDAWPAVRANTTFGPMLLAARYQTRPELLAGTIRRETSPAEVQWTYDNDNVYLLARCPEDAISDQRNTEWPDDEGRWWGTDGLQVQLASLDVGNGAKGRVFDIGFKPGGVMLVRTGETSGDGQPIKWSGALPVAGVRYGISTEHSDKGRGYIVEAAIPRSWVDTPNRPANLPPAWRVNVLRHRAGDLTNASWSGPLLTDDDVALMGILVGG